jgi:DNA replication protein DnaD
MAKEAFYFSHDSNARHDPKILAMRSVFGMEGYGWYWVIIEMLREQEDYKIKITKHVYNALAMQMQCDAMQAQCYIDACIQEHELLHTDGEFFWSESLLKRMQMKDTKSEKAKKAAEARWKKANKNKGSVQSQSERNADALQTQSDRNAIKEKKVKEIKEKKNKEVVVEEPEPTSNLNDIFRSSFNYEPSPNQIDFLSSYIDQDGMEEDLVLFVLKQAGILGKEFSYAKGWLNNLTSKKILTLSEAIKANEEHERKKQQSQANNVRPFRNNNAPVKTVPDYLKQDGPAVNINPQQEEENAKWLDELLSGKGGS